MTNVKKILTGSSKKEPTMINLSADTKEKIDKIAIKHEISRSQLIENLLKDFIENYNSDEF